MLKKKKVPYKTAPTDQENNQTLEYCSQKDTAASLQPSPPWHFAYPLSFHCPLSNNRGISNARCQVCKVTHCCWFYSSFKSHLSRFCIPGLGWCFCKEGINPLHDRLCLAGMVSSPQEQSNESVPSSTLQYRTTIDTIEQLLVNGLTAVSLVSV